ncbi:MAG: hypothetical protein M5U29_15165 [Anaerolineae bacterium]|nr:hypothetical protein [Anaerolineae bacterium]
MVKAKSQPDKKADAAPRKPLDAFAHHQVRALEETGKALASLLPQDFRAHAGKAFDETRASWEALFDGVLDSLECGVDKLRGKPKAGDDKEKVKVEVE